MTKVHRAAFYPKPPEVTEEFGQFVYNGKVFDQATGLSYLEAMEWLRRDRCEEGWGPYKRVRRMHWHPRDYVRNGASGGYVRRALLSHRPKDWEGPDEYHAPSNDMNAMDWEIVTTHAVWVDTKMELYGGTIDGFWT